LCAPPPRRRAAGKTRTRTLAHRSPKTKTKTTPQKQTNSSQICFGVQSPAEIVACGALHVHDRTLYRMPDRAPAPGGPLDRRLGVSSKVAACGTCGLKLADCAGHFGYIKLELPVFHIGYFRTTIQILQCICKRCSRVLLPPEELASWLRRFRRPGLERAQREAMFRRVLDLCKRVRVCPHCGEWNGVVK
jgi:DNA-directed RNA polymerase III subunit RPC1